MTRRTTPGGAGPRPGAAQRAALAAAARRGAPARAAALAGDAPTPSVTRRELDAGPDDGGAARCSARASSRGDVVVRLVEVEAYGGRDDRRATPTAAAGAPTRPCSARPGASTST